MTVRCPSNSRSASSTSSLLAPAAQTSAGRASCSCHSWSAQRDQGTASIGRGLYVERLTAGSMAAPKEMPPYYAQKMIPPPDSWDPPEGPLYFAKKTFPPLTCQTHQLYLRMQGSASLLRTKNEYPLLAGTHHSGRMTCGPTKLTGTEGFVNLVNMNDSNSSDRTMSIQRL